MYGPERLKPGTYSSSPVLADGRLYISNEEGLTVVFKSGPAFEVLAENPLERIHPQLGGDFRRPNLHPYGEKSLLHRQARAVGTRCIVRRTMTFDERGRESAINPADSRPRRSDNQEARSTRTVVAICPACRVECSAA